MPYYAFKCRKCGKEFEKHSTISAHATLKPKCPKCGSSNIEQVMTNVFAKTSKKS